MHVFFTPDLSPSSSSYALSEEESKHCARVLRLGTGDTVQLIDGKGGQYLGEISEATPKRTVLQIQDYKATQKQWDFKVHIAVAPTKNLDRMEWFLEKAVEIGVDEITFLQCARSERKDIKLERLEKIAVSAMKQSLKTHLPRLHPVTKYTDFLTQITPETTFIAHLVEGQERHSLAKSLAGNQSYTILIGPEGDFSPEEVQLALAKGIKPVTLGTSRLRTETAALAACHTFHVVLDV